MELEDLKMSWNVLNERLEQNEVLNRRIIKEMITTRTESAYERLFRFDLLGLVGTIGFSILVPVMHIVGNIGMKPLSFALLEGTMVLALISQLFIFLTLVRFNLEKKKLTELTRLTLIYKLWVKRSYTYGVALAGVVFIAFYIIQKAYLLSNGMMRLGIALLFASSVMYYSIRFYQKNIRILEKGLEELKEFEKEDNLE